MLDQPIPTDPDSDDDGEYSDSNDFLQNATTDLPWYKFNVHGQFIKLWDSVFALAILFNIIWAPLAIAF